MRWAHASGGVVAALWCKSSTPKQPVQCPYSSPSLMSWLKKPSTPALSGVTWVQGMALGSPAQPLQICWTRPCWAPKATATKALKAAAAGACGRAITVPVPGCWCDCWELHAPCTAWPLQIATHPLHCCGSLLLLQSEEGVLLLRWHVLCACMVTEHTN